MRNMAKTEESEFVRTIATIGKVCTFHNECLCDQCCYDCSVSAECEMHCTKDVYECMVRLKEGTSYKPCDELHKAWLKFISALAESLRLIKLLDWLTLKMMSKKALRNEFEEDQEWD